MWKIIFEMLVLCVSSCTVLGQSVCSDCNAANTGSCALSGVDEVDNPVLCICNGTGIGDFCQNNLLLFSGIERFSNQMGGRITSPGYPNPSPDQLQFYYYIIQIPEARSIELQFESFCTEIVSDFLYYGSGTMPSVQFYPADEQFLNGCFNDTVPSNLVIPGDSAWLRYDTDQNVQSDGWALTYSIDGNDCNPNMCLNGAVCNDLDRNFTCDCLPGFEGDLCETDINECENNPCIDNGSCLDLVNNFFCFCVLGYTGRTCETVVDPCNPDPCQNGAICNQGQGLSFSCTCQPGFTGDLCNIVFDQCANNPCQNGATCFAGTGGIFFCNCVEGFTGTICNVEINNCDSTPCLNGATCINLVNAYMCLCDFGFIGTMCEDDFNECASSPCQNGGGCADAIGSFVCTCVAGWTGLMCEQVDDLPPVIDCEGLDVSGTIPLKGFGTTVQFREPTATDNSGTANVQSRTHTPGQFFQSGTTQVTYVFIDPSGNTAECSFYIIIYEGMELEIQLMDIINTITRENTTTKEVVLASERIAEISDVEDFLEEDPQRIELVISSLESVVRAGEASINVTDPAVRTIDNLMNLDRDILEDGMIEGGRAVAALEGQITNFQTNDGNFSTVLDNVGVNAVKIDARSVGSSLAYANILPENETLSIDGALQEGNTRLFSDGDAIPFERTTTSISVPTTVLDLLGGASVELTAVPVTFIIYGNDVLFRPSMPTKVEENIEEEDNSTVTERIASQIISAIIRTENTSIMNLPPGSPVIATFLSNLKIGVKETIEAQDCVVWSYNENTREGFWTKDGCKRMFHDSRDLTMCSCDRLGSFAILIRVHKGPVEAQVTLYYITLIGSIISGLALVGCLITFVSLKSLRSKQPTHIHINLCISLLGFYIAFLLSPLAVGKEIHCTVASVFIHFFCLATLAWMSTEAMNMYYLFLKAERSTVRHFIPIACLLAYGLPAACALLVVFLDNSTDFQSASYCFIHPGYALYFGFLMEVGAMFVFNFIIFIWVIRKILCRPLMVSKTAENAKRNEIIKRVRHAILFWFVLGLSWIFGFFAAVDTKTLIFDYLYCFFISIQGILMFLLLCVANPAFKEKFKRTDSTQTKVTRQAKTRSLSSSQLGSSSQSNIPMDSMDNPSTSATE